MTTGTEKFPSNPRIDAAALFEKLGLTVADERPIMAAWREANTQWRRERAEKITELARQVKEELRCGESMDPAAAAKPISMAGRPRPVRCVELGRHFPSISAAARFVNRKASNISQALSRGGVCGPYHWEAYDPNEH